MPVSNFTAKLLEMEDTIIEDLHTTNSEVHIFFSLKRKPHTCPHCHTVTEKVHGYRLSILKDLPIMSKKLFYIIVKDTIIVRAVINIFTNPSDYSQSTAASLHISLSIDEFRRNAGGQKFQAILTDADKHKLFDILPSRSQVSLMQYLQDFPNKKEVRYFVTDMNKIYRDLASEYFPDATIVVDKFHVIRYVTWALENVRKRVQKLLHPGRGR